MQSIFDQMQDEHNVIKDMIVVFEKVLAQLHSSEKSVPEKDLTDSLLFFSEYADKYHHGKEEDIVFPLADRQGIVTQQGGRKCSLFFGMFTESNHLSEVLLDVKNHPYEIPAYKAKASVQQLIDKNSPLTIPLSEHEVGYYSMQLMNAELGNREKTREKTRSENKSWSSDVFLKVASRYLAMLRGHIRKEDECLFAALRETFDVGIEKQAQQLFAEFNAINVGLQESCLQILKRLSSKYI